MTISLAHVSDPHLALPAGPLPWRAMTAKQLLALLSWHVRRRHVTSSHVLAALQADIAACAPDHIAITGDLVNLALPAEFAQATDWLAGLGPAERLSLVPGNHEATCRQPPFVGHERWETVTASDREDDGALGSYPFLRRRSELALIGLSSAVPTPLFVAAGHVGALQRAHAARMLDAAGRDGLFRVVLMHHSPILQPGGRAGGRRKALLDRAALAAMLSRHGAELVLHGHHHRSTLAWLPGPAGPIPAFGVASASAERPRPDYAGWTLHRIEQEGHAWRLQTTVRRFQPGSGRFATVGDWTLRSDRISSGAGS